MIRSRPDSDLRSKYADAEQAVQEQIITHQTRKRAGQLDDGTTVLEEQDVVFTERRIVWDRRRIESADPKLKNGHGEIEVDEKRTMADTEVSKAVHL